jgi:phosphatidylserine decarboxylase
MTALHRRPGFLRAYELLPQRLVNRSVARITAIERPRWAVDAAVRSWVRAERIELDQFEARRFVSLDDFFLRRLRPGARPLGAGFVSPVDGRVLAAGTLSRTTELVVKGQRLSLERIVNAGIHDRDLSAYEGGSYAVVFLSPRGYHRVHLPADGWLRDASWIPGRFFPQNEDALSHIPGVYERNERAVLGCSLAAGSDYLLVMVGASLIGGIHLADLPRDRWVGPNPTELARRHAKGDEIGHFAFGSTVVVLLPAGVARRLPALGEVRMGQTLFELG